MTLFFATLVVATGSLLGTFTLFMPQTVSAAPSCGWINDRLIRCTEQVNSNITNTIDLIDSNPNDTNRTFKATTKPDYCKNAEAVNTIVMGSTPSNATYFHITTTQPPITDDVVRPDALKVDCEIQSSVIGLQGVAAATKPSTDCDQRPGGGVQGCLDDLKDGNAAFATTCSSPYSQNSAICTATAAPGYTQPQADPNANPTQNADKEEPHPCDSLGGDFSLRWIFCPILTAGMGMADALDGFIEANLSYDTNIFNETTEQGKGFKSAWGAFRSIGLALVLVAGLVMIVSQGSGLGFVDAYTIRKVMPRLLVAVIGITLSWELLAFIITFFNDMGHWIQDLILLPFQNAASGGKATSEGQVLASVAGALSAVVIGGTGALLYGAALGPVGILSMLGTVLLALLVGWLVLIIRSVIITVLILFAPLAFACYILPNTKKVWDFWQNALITMLMVFPIIMALIAAGKAMALITEDGLMKVIFLIAPYFFIPFAFKLAGGLMSTVFSMVNDKGRGGFDRLRNVRANQMKSRFDDAVNMRQNNAVSRLGMGSVARRLQNANQGGLSFSKRGRAQYGSTKSRIAQAAAAKALENDHGMAAGNDTANSLALQEGMTKERFVSNYAQEHQKFMASKGVTVSNQEATKAAWDALGSIEAGYGAELGSSAMRVAAFKAKAASTTGYKAGDWNAIANDAAPLMASGLMNEADVMGAVKANKARTDLSGVGSSTILAEMTRVKQRHMADKTNTNLIDNDEKSALLQDALFGSQPGAIVGARHEAVEALAPEMLKSLGTIKQGIATGAINKETGVAYTDADYRKQLAAVAGQYDVMSQVSRQNAGKMDRHLMSQTVAGDTQTVQQMVESLRNDKDFQERRREYAQQQAAGYQAQQAALAQAGAQQQPPGQIPQNPGQGQLF